MCDYCGCRRQPVINELSEEHERLLDAAYTLGAHARRGDHAAAVEVVTDEIAPLLEVHTHKEEGGLFAELRRAGADAGHIGDLVAEHRDIDRMVALVLNGRAGWQAEANVLATTLSAHIVAEETDLFPYALYQLDERQWQAVEAVHRRLSPVGATTHRAHDEVSATRG